MLGGAGFQGRHLVERLLKEGAHVRVFDKATCCPRYEDIETNRLEYISGNFASIKTIEPLLKGIDVIFHLISTTLPKSSNDDMVNDVVTNIIPTLYLLECALKEKVKKIIYFSSGGTVYGIPRVIPTPEDHPNLPICSYGIHKIAIEHYLNLYFVLYGLDYRVMRVSNPYGIYQNSVRGQGAIPVFLRKLMQNDPIDIWGDGTVVRDYIHVDDIVDAALKLSDYRGSEKVFNIGSGNGVSLNELLAEIVSISGQEAKVNYLSARKIDVPVSVLDISKASRELDWRPQVSLRDGVSQLEKEFKKHIDRHVI